MNLTAIRALFSLAAAYDGLLGLLFLITPARLFAEVEVTPPNHFGYVQFPAALLLIFSLMFVQIARAPHTQAGLILYGILLKLAYCGITFAYWFSGGIPWVWKPFAIIDLVMLALFAYAWKSLQSRG